MQISPDDRTILRGLAKRVEEIAALPVIAERREMWKRHNSLRRVRPMVLVFPEGSWRELLPGGACRCEGLARKLDDVFTIRNLRRVSISPFADVDAAAEKLRDRYIFSWKPHPAHLCGAFDAGRIRRYIQHTIDVTKGCVVEMILKDTHTCDGRGERFTQWTDIASRLAAEAK